MAISLPKSVFSYANKPLAVRIVGMPGDLAGCHGGVLPSKLGEQELQWKKLKSIGNIKGWTSPFRGEIISSLEAGLGVCDNRVGVVCVKI